MTTTPNEQPNRNIGQPAVTNDGEGPLPVTTGIVYVVLDGYFSKGIKIQVKEGDDVSSIKNKIKKEASPIFDSVSMVGVELFKSEGTINSIEAPLNKEGGALNTFMEWNSEVTWGKKEKPLIVDSPPAITMTNRNGECYVRLCVCECAFADEIF